MTRREVQLLWAGLVVGFMLGAVVAVIVLAHVFGAHATRIDAHSISSPVSFFLEVPIILTGTKFLGSFA
jgi:hypothetical protein